MTAPVPGPAAGDGRLTPYGLTCELTRTPLGIGERSPRLSWKLRSPRRGDAQTAYRLRVMLQPAGDGGGQTVWDSGRQESAENLQAVYDGPPLQSSTRYHWQVTVWDSGGAEAGTARSWFETALLHPDEWRACWIGRDPATEPGHRPPQDGDRSERTRRLPPCAYLRRAFRLPERPARARAYLSARGLYEFRLNGQRAGDAELAPGWTDYRQRVLYQCYDITGLLRAGENAAGAILADGWWSGYVGFDTRHQAQHYGRAPQFIGQLVLDFADGSRRLVVTDGSWRERPGAIRYADLLMGEYVDARDQPDGWDLPGYDDSGWQAALVLGTDTGVLEPSPDPPVRVVRELPAAEVTSHGEGRFIADLGQNMAGRVRLTIRNPSRGQRVRLRHAEVLAGGEPYVANLRTAEATDTYVARGEPEEVFEPRFTYHGFRYVEVSGYPGELRTSDVTGRALHSDTAWTGEFACSDPVVSQLVSNIRWSQLGNFVSVPTDCPQRDERLGWLADAQVFLPTACRNADVSAFFSRWMTDVIGAQDDDGAFSDVAPRACIDREGAPAWGDGGVIIPWQLYESYGDTRLLERCYPAMAAWVDHIRRHNPGLIWRARTGNSYGDWLHTGPETPGDLLATAYFARSARLTAQAARVLGRHDDAERYTALHAAIREAFIREFVHDDGRVSGGTQTGYLLALGFGLIPADLRQAAAGHLAADIESRQQHLTTGFVGVSLLCPVLTEHGYAGLAYALLHQESYPSWGYSIRRGATTIWERWDGWTEEHGFQSAVMNSFNHYSLGSVGDWLFGSVAGIGQQPGSVAYRHLLLRPTVGGRLTWARADQETARGQVSCGWRRTGDRLAVEVSVPPGCTAELHLPASDPGSLTESGADPARSPGVSITGTAGDAVIITLVSGRYSFSAAYDAGQAAAHIPVPARTQDRAVSP